MRQEIINELKELLKCEDDVVKYRLYIKIIDYLERLNNSEKRI